MNIGIPLSLDDRQYKVNRTYFKYVLDSGYTPIPLIPDYTPECDGLLLPGGVDIDPVFYGENNLSSYWTNLEKDDFERSLFHHYFNNGKKIFGICRGQQLIFLELKRMFPDNQLLKSCKYHQDINYHDGILYGSREIEKRNKKVHDVIDTETGSRVFVNSFHHQVISISDEFKNNDKLFVIKLITGYQAIKGKFYVEGFNFSDNISCVQFHPEEFGKEFSYLLTSFFGE